MRESWTDDRLDHMSVRMEERREARAEFAALNERFDSLQQNLNEFQHDLNALQRTLLQVGGGLIGALATALIALVATQL